LARFGSRTRARSQALQLLFQADATDRTVDEVLEDCYVVTDESDEPNDIPLDEYAERLARGAAEHMDQIDQLIADASVNWSVGRMNPVDRNLLRLAVYEIGEEPDVDVAVTIDEVVELAKAYGGTDESSKFVNGVLGRIAQDLAATQVSGE